MATKYSDLATKQATPTPDNRVEPENFRGRVRCARFKYVGAADDAAGTVINLVKLPKAARVLPLSRIFFEAGQDAALTVKVGDAADDDRYLAATAPGASATSLALDAAAAAPLKLADDGYITLTTAAKALTASKYIAGEILWVID